MRSRLFSGVLPMLCSGAMLLACSNPAVRPANPPGAIVPADDIYLRGRNLHLERRYDEAIAAYRAALELDAGHVNARNGLAIAYAERREFDKAIPLWRKLTQGASMASGPGKAFLFANLGYAYFLQGDNEEAAIALEKACLLDPLNARAWQYLGETLQRQGQPERAEQMLRQASALRNHDLRADYAAAGGGARLRAIEQAVQSQRKPDESDRDWAHVELRTMAGGLLELRRIARPQAAQPAAPRASAGAATDDAVAALEISNGNGRQGLARQVAGQLRDPGIKVVRLTNEKGFAVRQTRVEYQAPFRGLAERLAERFKAGKPVEAKLAGHTDVRLVIGRDLEAAPALPQPPDAAPQDRLAGAVPAP